MNMELVNPKTVTAIFKKLSSVTIMIGVTFPEDENPLCA